MVNGPCHRENHQPKGKGRERHFQPLIDFYTCKNTRRHDGYHFESQVGIADKVIQFFLVSMEFILFHWSRLHRPWYRFP